MAYMARARRPRAPRARSRHVYIVSLKGRIAGLKVEGSYFGGLRALPPAEKLGLTVQAKTRFLRMIYIFKGSLR